MSSDAGDVTRGKTVLSAAYWVLRAAKEQD